MIGRAKEGLIERLNIVFKEPCFSELRLKMVEKVNHLNNDQDNAIAIFKKLVQSFERIWPKEPKARFFIDAWLLQSALDDLNKNLTLSRNITPFYLGEWLYFIPPQPMFKGEGGSNRIYGISFPGSDDVGDFHPLDYSWLYHEIGHHITDRIDGKIFEPVQCSIKDVLSNERRRLPSASQSVKSIMTDRLKRFQECWNPEQPENWTAEIISDVISLWCCGPAFLRTMEEVFLGYSEDPFSTNSTHPPNALRLRLLIEAGEKLGWTKYLGKLSDCDKKWARQNKDMAALNEYHAMLHGNIPSIVLKMALEICKGCQFSLCSTETLHQAREWSKTAQSVTSTSQLILGAWVKCTEDLNNYEHWQQDVLNLFIDELKE